MAPVAAWDEAECEVGTTNNALSEEDDFGIIDDDEDIGPRPVEEVLASVRDHVFQRRLRVKECFSDFDRLHRGRVTKPQFVRGMKVLFSGLPHEEAEVLADHYTEPPSRFVKSPEVVSYARFAEDVDKIFGTLRSLEKRPQCKVPSPGGSLCRRPPCISMEGRPQLPRSCSAGSLRSGPGSGRSVGSTAPSSGRTACVEVEPSPAARSLVQRPSWTIQSEQVLLDRALHRRPASAASHGRSFTSDVASQSAASPAALRRPASAMSLGRSAVTELGGTQGDAASTQARSAAAPEAPASRPLPARPLSAAAALARRVEAVPRVDVLTKLKSLIWERRLRVSDAFLDFDRLRKGTCTASNLKAVMTLINLDLDPNTFDELYEVFRCPESGEFRYRDFCTEVGEPNASAPLSKGAGPAAADVKLLPHGSRPMSATMRSTTIRRKARLDNLDMERLPGLMARLRSKVKLRGMEIWSTFSDFSRRTPGTLPGYITIWQFPRAMAMLQLDISELESDILCKAYCDTDDGQAFNYRMFCADMDDTVSRYSRPGSAGSMSTMSLGVVGVGLGHSAGSAGSAGNASTAPSRAIHRRIPHNRYFDINGQVVSRCRPASAPAARRARSQPALA